MDTQEVFEICRQFRFLTVERYDESIKISSDGQIPLDDVERLLNEMVRVAWEWENNEENLDQTE